MKIKVLTSENFRRKAKRLLKKYPSLKMELYDLESQLLKNPEMGILLGRDCYKIRIAIQSKGKGKSSGARIITHVVAKISQDQSETKIVGLLTIYDKSEYENISDSELTELIDEVKLEIENSDNE